ncbi:MAG: SDR family oxidoreductase [Ardenticatenaceae bacterium]|nr:SDR family oxidoreductase [Ardenticatenaceae bacterium]
MEWDIQNWCVKPEKMFDLTGRVAIVTGGASGIGRAIALGLDAFGVKVVVADLNLADAEAVVARFQSEGFVLRADVTKMADVQNVVSTTTNRFGKLDIFFNIPGVNVRKPVLNLSENEWRSVLEINLTGMFLCSREVGKAMLEQGSGTIVNMASVRGLVGGHSQSVYSVSKAGVIQLTRCLAIELAPYVRVNALAPGYVETPLVREIMKDEVWSNKMRNLHAMKRFAQPEEIVGSALFLASDASSFVTGTVLCVDGGWTAGTL